MTKHISSQYTKNESSEKLVEFLNNNNLHKKDFAEMIGVTLSYVYSLTDKTIPFSTRTTTLERIAVVMGLEPFDFPEYKAAEEPKLIDSGIQFLKDRQEEIGLSNIEFIKKFPKSKRAEIVDLWRGAAPLSLDWNNLVSIAKVLDLSKEEIYPYWQARMQQYLMSGGIDLISNAGLLNSMFNGVKSYLKI